MKFSGIFVVLYAVACCFSSILALGPMMQGMMQQLSGNAGHQGRMGAPSMSANRASFATGRNSMLKGRNRNVRGGARGAGLANMGAAGQSQALAAMQSGKLRIQRKPGMLAEQLGI